MTSFSRRVLVVDDNREVADLFTEILSLHGIGARAAYGGAEALALVSTFQPNIVILNLAMPDIDGFRVARILREQGATTPYLIALSSLDDHATRAACEAAGFDRYLRKPSSMDTILAAVRHAKIDHPQAADTRLYPSTMPL